MPPTPAQSEPPASGSPDPALVAAWARLEQPLLRYATRIVRDPNRARDVVHDTFVRLCEARELPDNLDAWLHRVCHNEAVDLLRRERASVPLEEAALCAVAPEAEARHEANEVRRAIDELPPKQREVLTLRVEDGHDYRSISQRTGLSISHVGVLIHEATRSLRVRLAVMVSILLLLAAGTWRAWPNPPPLLTARRLELPRVQVPMPEPPSGLAGDPPPEQKPAPTKRSPGPTPPPSRPQPPRKRMAPSML